MKLPDCKRARRSRVWCAPRRTRCPDAERGCLAVCAALCLRPRVRSSERERLIPESVPARSTHQHGKSPPRQLIGRPSFADPPLSFPSTVQRRTPHPAAPQADEPRAPSEGFSGPRPHSLSLPAHSPRNNPSERSGTGWLRFFSWAQLEPRIPASQVKIGLASLQREGR